ncbi:MAG: hypothetical protein ACYCSF_11710 [Acidimicrobiales bacterium]
MNKIKSKLSALPRCLKAPSVSVTAAFPGSSGHRALRNSASGLGVLALVAGGVLGATPSAFASSGAPTHGKTTCAIAGDECTNAMNYANANDGGGARVLAVEADTETHGGTVSHRVFDFRMKTNKGIYNLHVYRNDNAAYKDGVWWQKRAENQNSSGGSDGSPSDTSPDTSTSTDATTPDTSPDKPASGASSTLDSPKISATQAASDATSFATNQGYQVLAVKKNRLNSSGQKVYYQIKLQLGQRGENHGTTNVWVDATSSPGTVTAAAGSGLDYRDTNLVSLAATQANATAATGGGSVYKTSINGGKWRWYWVFVRKASLKYKVGVDAVTGVVTQVRQSP